MNPGYTITVKMNGSAHVVASATTPADALAKLNLSTTGKVVTLRSVPISMDFAFSEDSTIVVAENKAGG